MIKVVFLAANPGGTTPPAIADEVRAIDAKIRGATRRERLQLVSHWAVDLDDLSGLLMRERPDIVHFSGHGSKSGQIILIGDDGTPKPVPPASLAERFRILRDNIRAVVLDACYTEPQARAIVRSIDCAVGMTDAIGDRRAIDFAAAFYEGLAYGRSVQESFDLGVARLSDAGVAQGSARLHRRRGVDPSSLVLIGDDVEAKLATHDDGGPPHLSSPTATGPVQATGDRRPPLVFISYSHADRTWLDRFRIHLTPLERQGSIECWDDTRLRTGMRWHNQIKSALATAKAAVLLVSADFLASDFIVNDELPPLLAAEQARGLVVMPVIISPSRFLKTPSLAQFQAVNPDLKPLKDMTEGEQDALWDRLVDDIEEALVRDPR